MLCHSEELRDEESQRPFAIAQGNMSCHSERSEESLRDPSQQLRVTCCTSIRPNLHLLLEPYNIFNMLLCLVFNIFR